MKLGGILVLSLFFFGLHTDLNAQAKIKLKSKKHQFDKCQEGDQLACDFTFTNSGDEPVIISHYEVECTCTRVDFPKEPIMPGEQGTIHVDFDSTGKMGWQYRTILLYNNSPKSPVELEIIVKVLNES